MATPNPDPAGAALLQTTGLWLTSRSAHERGTQDCPFKRWLEYHAGPYGYGFQRRALSLPLVTGTYVDKPISAICQWLIDYTDAHGTQPTAAPDEVIRWAAALAIQKYRATVEKRGLLALAADDAQGLANLHHIINEQCTLIEGLVWTFSLVRLPQILATYRLRAVQPECVFVEGCTCGLGDLIGTPTVHEGRGCQGIAMQSRPDLLGSRWSDDAWGYLELKTASTAKRAWNESWERKQQFLLGILGAELRYGVEITHALVEGLVKGQRKRDYGVTDPTAVKKQQNALCYGYLRPANPGLTLADWLPSYQYYDNEGLQHRAPRDYKKTALWEAGADAFPSKPVDMTRSEWWTKYLFVNYPATLAKSLNTIGPIPKQVAMLDKALRSSVTEEHLWQERTWKIYDWTVANPGKGWGSPEYHAFVESVVPRSWNCDPFGPDHPCAMQPLCFEHEGWAAPIESRLYVYRNPHHALEAAQMAARGLQPEEGVGFEQDEDDDGDWGE